ncbi:MAG: ABC transporter permease [Lachnospiraceae bacterium]|nr:ABC transporter permease [Lachnospiraceae bacterium]
MEKKQITSSLWKRNLRKFFNNKLAVLGLAIMLVILFCCIAAPLITDYLPNAINLKELTQAPQSGHLFGTDKQGRDVFSRVLYGGRTSILIGVISSLMGSFIGVALGAIAGYFGGIIDAILVRISEIFSTFPQLILILVLVSIIGPGVFSLIVIFGVTGWMTTFRMIRTEFITLREETYVQVARAFGMSKRTIMFREILPNAFSPVIAATTINVAGFILSEAGLSFIGLGVPSGTPTWGNILNAAKGVDVITNFWWLWLIPGIVLSLFILGVNFVGDGLRDVLDPKQL